jgi:outer membrane protein assembly factor BamB
VAHRQPRATLDSALDGDIYYIAAHGDSTHSGSVSAYSAASGTMLWQKDLGLNANPHISASGDTLYLSLGRSFEALRGSDGTVLWQQSPSTPLAVPPIVVDGTLYFNNYGEVFAFNASDGSPRWHYRPQQPFGEGATTLAVGGGFVFAGSGTSVIALHDTDGTLAWSKECRNIPFGTAVSSGVVYAACSNGGLDAFQATDGQPIWSVQLNGDHAWPAVVTGNTVFVGVTPGVTPNGAPAYVYALRPGDGSVMWQLTATSAGFVSAPVVA